MRSDIKLSVVIAVWDGIEHVIRCVESLYRNTSVPWELVLVDNASTDGAQAYCEFLSKAKPNVKLIRNAENLGFGPAQNQGVAASEGEFVCNLNSDTVVTPGWAEGLIEALEEPYPFPVGMVGCMSGMSAGRQQAMNIQYQLHNIDEFGREWTRQHRGQRFEVGVLFGWCLVSRRDVWDKIGGFDPIFKNGFEDNDLSLRMNLAGYRLRVAADVFIHHHGQGTILSHFTMGEYAKSGEDNRRMFVEKWRQPGPKKLVAVMRIANCERTIRQVLDRTARFADQILVHLCRSTDRTEMIVRQHPKVTRVEVYNGPFQEDFERDRLLQMALEEQAAGRADWAISIDGDELYDDRMIERAQALMNPAWPHVMAYWCNWRTIWDKDPDGTEWYRAEDTFGSFKNYRFWRLMPGQRILSRHPEGHHCGSAPVFPVENLRWTNIRVKHLGYDTPELRQRKFEFYQAQDNFKNRADIGHDDYRHLIEKTVGLRKWQDKNGISVVMLVGNEQGFMEGFLDHIVPIADEIVAISTLKDGEESDGTWEHVLEWAKSSPVPVKTVRIPWEDNYALMRNKALEHATKEWVLMMDPDERFDPTEVQILLDLIDVHEVDGFIFHVFNYLQPKGASPKPVFIPSDAIRLFRRLPELYYTGIVHETLEDSLAARRARGEGRGMVAEAPMPIHHHGYLKPGDRVKRKCVYYAQLNQRQIDVTGGEDARPVFNLAMHAMEEDDYERSRELLRQAKDLDPMMWRARTMIVASHAMQIQAELRGLLEVAPRELPVFKHAKEALDMFSRFPFLHAKLPRFDVAQPPVPASRVGRGVVTKDQMVVEGGNAS